MEGAYNLSNEKPAIYGGQAVIEGVMFAGKTVHVTAVRHKHEGIKFYGSPITPSFHRQNWAFNADRGEEIKKYWARIPSDVNVLITHGPPYGIMDTIPLKYKQTPDEDIHRGCQDLLNVIKKRLINLELHCFGHLHNHYGVIKHPVSNSREILFSNGSILNEDYTQIVIKPLIINL
jgi:Icc-related predicted phosphoesterase